jgi:ribonuclease R
LVNTESISEKGPEGRVVAITSRARTHLGGTIKQVGKDGSYYAYAPMLGMAQQVIVESDSTLIVGDRVVLEVIEWGSKDTPTLCRLSQHIGHISDPSCDIPAALEEFELRRDFPVQAITEARAFGKKVPLSEIRNREDLRSITCFTIDPDTAKDFDDAINLTKDSSGHYHLGVHIADVSHYVGPGSALDIEAQMRCNSTYFPGFCLPMLPRELSDNLCSLKANVNRLTVSVLMHLDADGTLVDYRLSRSVIKSCKRFTYKEAKAVLDGKVRSPHLNTLNLMVELCGHLKRKRYERGSIEFGMPELVVIVDEKGMPTKTDYIVYDITHQLVEEFMLKANEVVALHLSKAGKYFTYRIHDEPAEENMKDFSLLASAFGFHLSPTPTPREIQKLFNEAMSTSYGEYLASSYIRRMRLAMYSSDNIGHFGLSLSHYCHFTSPIRRYVDLVVHRTIFNENESKEKIEMIAQKCSEQERISAKAENSILLLKKLRLLEQMLKKEPLKQYEAVVTKVKNFGIYFEILELMMESSLHVSELEDDYYVFDEATVILCGRHHGQVYRCGDKITVMLKQINFITLDSEWTLVPESLPADRQPINKKKKKANRGEKQSFRRSLNKKKKGHKTSSSTQHDKGPSPKQVQPPSASSIRSPFKPRKIAEMIGQASLYKRK